MPYKDPQKQKSYQKKWYTDNKDNVIHKMKENKKTARQKVIEFVQEYKSRQSCVDCGEDNPIVLDFDHLYDKKFKISGINRRYHSLETVKDEIAKCEIRCANCHRIVTHERRLQTLSSVGQSA